jgi:hypothetical protein
VFVILYFSRSRVGLALRHVFLALGTGCTVAGLILGTVLARHLKLHALKGLKLNAVIIHHQYCQVRLQYISFLLFCTCQ